jgi:hypothetical protein
MADVFGSFDRTAQPDAYASNAATQLPWPAVDGSVAVVA